MLRVLRTLSRKAQNPGDYASHAVFSALFTFCLLLTFSTCLAEEPYTVITSDTLEYFTEGKQYVAKGSVKIEKEGSSIQADEITFYEETSDVLAEGNVRYEDALSTLKAGKAEINFEGKTGKLYEAEIFHKKDNTYLSGRVIEKRGENYYYSPEAKFTTCNAPVPAWCFRGKEVDVVIGQRLKARDVTFNIKGLPVLYTPYFLAPIITERQTGFLPPAVGYGRSRGLSLQIPYFWAISENRDATLLLDFHSKRGLGKGLEYRFINPGGVHSSWWVYHIRDSELNKDFIEIKGLHENRLAGGFGGFLNLNIVNEKRFYQEFNPYLAIRAQRFLESTGEFNVPMRNSRVYLLAQYWIDLENDTDRVAQRLPEIGYVLRDTKVGMFMFSTTINAANMWRKHGLSAGRLDIYPRVLHSFGKDFVISQEAALRGTAYSFYRNVDIGDDSLLRLGFEYNVTGSTRLFRKYNSFTHIIEPSVRYSLISVSENDLPVLDSAELYKRTSRVELSLLNRIVVNERDLAVLRLTQGFDTREGDRPFLPLKMELSIEKFLPVKLDVTYDVHSGKLETVSSELRFSVLKTIVSVGQRYNRKEDISVYKTQVEFNPTKSLQLAGSIWFDAKGGGLRDAVLSVRYLSQCWGIKFEYTKRPGDYTMMVMFELTGLFSNITGR